LKDGRGGVKWGGNPTRSGCGRDNISPNSKERADIERGGVMENNAGTGGSKGLTHTSHQRSTGRIPPLFINTRKGCFAKKMCYNRRKRGGGGQIECQLDHVFPPPGDKTRWNGILWGTKTCVKWEEGILGDGSQENGEKRACFKTGQEEKICVFTRKTLKKECSDKKQ